MKKAVLKYLEFDDSEKAKLWENAIFVFDTNVFLNLYRYTKKTRDQLLLAFEQLKDRIWMPYHVAQEFMKNRYEVIWDTNEGYNQLKSKADLFVNECSKILKIGNAEPELSELSEFITRWIESNREKNLAVNSPSNDEILIRLLCVFDGKVGTPFDDKTIEEIQTEGKERYSKQIPPGYKDAAKHKNDTDNNAYGDLIVWKEILNFATQNKKDIIFITHDQKEDWWNIVHGKTIGPRIELRSEFNSVTSQKFHMYNMINFIAQFNGLEKIKVDSAAIDEVELFSRIIHKKQPKKELQEYYGSFPTTEEAKAAKFRFEIMRLENKNRKRRNSISRIQSEYPTANRPQHIQEQLDNNIANLEKDELRISQIKQKLVVLK